MAFGCHNPCPSKNPVFSCPAMHPCSWLRFGGHLQYPQRTFEVGWQDRTRQMSEAVRMGKRKLYVFVWGVQMVQHPRVPFHQDPLSRFTCPPQPSPCPPQPLSRGQVSGHTTPGTGGDGGGASLGIFGDAEGEGV